MKIKTASLNLLLGISLLGIVIVSTSAISLSKTDEIQEIWIAFEEDRNEKLNALIALRSEIGYGGMVHHFKNYILRQRKFDADAIIMNVGGAKAALKRYQSLQLSTTEERALLHIEQTLDAYRNAFDVVSELIQKNKSPMQIDEVVKIDDKPALLALKALESETGLYDITNLNNCSQPLILSELRNTMGYGGVIHHFKNYILRNSPDALAQVSAKVERIHTLVEMYQRYQLSAIEKKALQKTMMVVQAYKSKLPIIKEMHKDGASVTAIDKIVYIDDTPALDGFNDLHRQIIHSYEERANQLNNSLKVVKISGQVIFYVTLISLFLIFSLVIWLSFYQITLPISRLNKVMQRLANNDLEVVISETEKRTEIGEMARTVKVFKENAIQKRNIEADLKEANENLEEKVKLRTQELKAKEARLTALVENAVDSIITINDHGIIQTFNAAAIAMFGYPAHEVVGKNVNILMPNPYKDEHNSYLVNYLKSGEKKIIGIGREVIGQHKNGTRFPIGLAVSEVVSENNNRLFSGIIRDLTENKMKERELQLSKEAADKANKAKSEFLSSMSHELKTPMNAVLGFSEILITDTETPLTDDQIDSVNQIIEGGQHLLKLINQVLDLSKIETGSVDVNFEKININELISSICLLMKPQADRRSIKIENNFTSANVQFEINADALKLKQVVLNIISNAIKYNHEKGTVTISCIKTDDTKIRLSIADSGAGVPEEVFPQLFEPFNRLDMVNSSIQGTGIGLTICKQLVKLMGGEIGVFRNKSKGLTFWVEFEEV